MAEYGYTQYENEIIIQFQENSAVKNLTGVTKFLVEFFGLPTDPINRAAPVMSIDSVTSPSLFDLTDIANGNVRFMPDSASLSSLTGTKYYGRFIIFSPSYPVGLVWAKTNKDLFEFVLSR